MTSSSPSCQLFIRLLSASLVRNSGCSASRLQPWYTWIESWRRFSMDCKLSVVSKRSGWGPGTSGRMSPGSLRRFSACAFARKQWSQWSYEYHWVSSNLQHGCNKTCLIWFVHARACASNRIACRSPWSLGHWRFSTSLTFICILFIERAETICFNTLYVKLSATSTTYCKT